MQSLATALTASRAKFSNELTYTPGMAPRSENRAALEKGGMQVNWKTLAFLENGLYVSSEFQQQKCTVEF